MKHCCVIDTFVKELQYKFHFKYFYDIVLSDVIVISNSAR